MSDSSNDLSSSEIRVMRARSRSPPPPSIAREKQPSPRTNTQAKSIIKETSSEVISEKESERRAERLRKCLPDIRDKHLTVCSSTLWLGHVPKTVSEADISDAFGEFGTITSIDVSIVDQSYQFNRVFSRRMLINISQCSLFHPEDALTCVWIEDRMLSELLLSQRISN